MTHLIFPSYRSDATGHLEIGYDKPIWTV
jgi:hypothetical protein